MTHIAKIWRAAPLAMLMTALAVTAEAVSNGLRAYGIGEHLALLTVATPWGRVSLAGGVMVAGAAAISVYQAKFATILLTSRVTAQRWIASPFLVLCLLISGASMVSHVLEAQRAKGAGESGHRGAFDRNEFDYLQLKGELIGLGNPRTPAVINAEIARLGIDRSIWHRSKQCTDVSREDTRAACAPIQPLRIELGNFERRAVIEPKIEAAKRKLDATERPAELPWLDQTLAFLWPWAFGAGVVLVATFGYAVATMQAKPRKPFRAEPEPRPEPDRPRQTFTRQEAEADLLWLIAHEGGTPTWGDLATRYGWKSKATVSKLVDDMVADGLLRKHRQGKRMLLEAA